MPKEIHSSQPITIAEAFELLKEREKDAIAQDKELSYMQKEAMDHARFTTRLTGEDASSLSTRLMEEMGISPLGAISLTNTLPTTIDEVRQILDVEARKMETETIKKILEIIQSVERIEEIPEEEYYTVEEEEFDLVEKEIDESQIPDDL